MYLERRKVSRNFYTDELCCKCCGVYKIEDELLQKLQQLRDLFGKSIIINSGYRCEDRNLAIGGAKNSKHLLGQAVDIACSNTSDAFTLVRYAIEVGFKGIGVDKLFIHLDIRKDKEVLFTY